MTGIPPIEVYQVGDAYFVQDGNHRVSIARRLNSKTITAYVIEVKTRVPFAADDDPNEIICKAHYADFLEKSNLDKLRPDVDLQMTFCGQYQIFLEQIEAEFKAVKSLQKKHEESTLVSILPMEYFLLIDFPDNLSFPDAISRQQKL